MQTPLEFFSEHCGSIIDPDSDPVDVLTRCYKHYDKDKTAQVRMGGPNPARFLISEGKAKIWSPIASIEHAEGKVEFVTSADRLPRDWLVDIIMNPPIGPFLAVSLGMATADLDHWQMSISSEMIIFSGASAMHDKANTLIVNRAGFLQAKKWFEDTGVSVSDLLRRQETLVKYKRSLISGALAKAIVSKIKTPAEVLDTYVGPTDSYQMRLAYYAATEWSAK